MKYTKRQANIDTGIAVVLATISILLFTTGFHAIDLSWNVLKISYLEGLDYYSFSDQYAFNGYYDSYDEVYIHGIYMLYASLVFALAMGFVLGKMWGKEEDE